jgi:predicted solute-binding protein
MQLLIHNTVVTGPLLAALTAGWVEPATDLIVQPRRELSAANVGDEDVALLPAPEMSHLQATHQVVPDVAVVAEGIGAVSLRTPVRPDEIERTTVKLIGTTGVGELLARATLQAYFGIQATAWGRPDEAAVATAEAVVLEGAEALRPIEGGFAEDLCRAWFILTGLPVVSHVLAAPLALTRTELRPVLDTLRVSREVGRERRREWRTDLIERFELDRERVLALLAGQRFELQATDRAALSALVQRGTRGTGYSPLTSLHYLDAEPEHG